MMPQSDVDNKKLFSELIKKQMLVLGPDITLAKVHNVTGLTVNVDGEVQDIQGDPQVLLQSLINQFVELSGMIVKKTMESILTSYPSMAGLAVSGMVIPAATVAIPSQPTAQTVQAASVQPAVESVTGSMPQQNLNQSQTQTIHSEPPPMTAMKLDSLSPNVSATDKKDVGNPDAFSQKEMEDLNKALEELSNSPISTEANPTQANMSN